MGYTLEDQIFEQLVQHYHDQRSLLIKDIVSRKPPVSLLRTLQKEEPHKLQLPCAAALIAQAPNKKRLLQLVHNSHYDHLENCIRHYCTPTSVGAN